jgi:hypothetical protein
MGFSFSSSGKYAVLRQYQQPILDAINKALPGAAAVYAPMPSGKVLLVVVYAGFETRNESEREELVRNSIIASLQINPQDYIAGFHCWTPREEREIKKAEDGSSEQA